MNDPLAPVVNGVILAAAAASLAVLFRLFQKHIGGQPLLAYEPRPVPPWNAAAPLLILAPLAPTIVTALLQPAAEVRFDFEIHARNAAVQTAAVGAPPATAYGMGTAWALNEQLTGALQRADSLPGMLIQSAAVSIVLAAACMALLALVFGATRRDLGFPADGRQLAKDVAVGAAAFAACLAPIYLFLLVLHLLFGAEEGHPLIQELLVNHSPLMMFAAALTAVVAAPVYEETAFRLVLQGWLERRLMPTQPVPAAIAAEPVASAGPSGDGPAAEPVEAQLAGGPSWPPIIISGTLFGLAHLGQGLSWAPMIALGIMLGYIYQRTHRIVPCIVCHMLFNGYTFLMLTLQFSAR